jgi:L-2-hydroxyglutarate oxidase LhgO
MNRDARVQFEAIVVGAGVVGLAVARALAARGLETLVVERHDRIGAEISSRNSGVVHSGIYYPTGSLKARLCVQGRERLYEYARLRGIAHRRCGKLVVAQAEQREALDTLYRRGLANGVGGLRWLEAADVHALEPEVKCNAALLSTDTGIIDVHELLIALQSDLEAQGGHIGLATDVLQVEPSAAGFDVHLSDHGVASSVTCAHFVNCAGLGAVALAHRIAGLPREQLPTPRYAKGNYFGCSGRPFARLVYPMPNEAGLGVHATLDLAGHVRFGPDVEWVERPDDLAVDASRAAAFEAAIHEYWPGLPAGTLRPDYAGVRPKLVGPGEAAADFRVEGPERHGIEGLFNLFGIESPGLTACLALGDFVANALESETRAA